MPVIVHCETKYKFVASTVHGSSPFDAPQSGASAMRYKIMFSNLTTQEHYLLAGNPELSVSALEHLSWSTDARVRARVAEHSNSSLRTLYRLAHDESEDVRQSIGYNARFHSTLLHLLAEDRSVTVRYALAENGLLPVAILEKLVGDENPYVAHRAAKTLSRMQLQTHLQAA